MRSNLASIEREILRRDLAVTGNLLVDVLALDRQFARRYARRPAKDALRELQQCRRILGHLLRDYLLSVGRYRRAIKKGLAREHFARP